MFVAGIVAFGSNSYQQALDYASALNKPSSDLPTLIADNSNSALYWSIGKFLEFGLSPFLISLIVNFILLYFFLNRLFKVNTLIGFKDIHAVALTFFMVFTYTFLSPFAYEIQVLGTITQGRMTPLLILLLMSLLLSPSQPIRDFKIILVICLTLSIHPIMGIFLLNFTILVAVIQKSKILNLSVLCLINVISILTLLQSRISQASNDSSLFSEFLNSFYGKNFCHHYSNIMNFANSGEVENNLRNFAVYLITIFLILYKYRAINSVNAAFGILSIFLVYAFLLSIFLNLNIIMDTPLSNIAFSIMPLRFLDAANMFVFPMLLMILLKTVGMTFFVLTR